MHKRCLAVTILMLVCGCGDRSVPAVPQQQVTRGTASIAGRVKFLGVPPEMATIENKPCHEGAVPLKEETVIVNANGTLKNVFVYVVNGPKGSGAAEAGVKLDQHNCQYVPHVLGVQVGQAVVLSSSDHVLHNVHYRPTVNRPENFGFSGAGQTRTVSFAMAEFVRVKCDIHPWMTAWIGVFENPFFAVTDEAGAFTLSGLPAGTYTLATWHERYGELRTEVTVSDGQAASAELTYQPPAENK